jgi:hypothetical protein
MPSHPGDGVVQMPSHASDGATESCWRWCCQGDLAATQCRCRVMLAIVLPSQAVDGAAEATWPRRDMDVESCWR